MAKDVAAMYADHGMGEAKYGKVWGAVSVCGRG